MHAKSLKGKAFSIFTQISNIDIKVLHPVESFILEATVFETGNILHVIKCQMCMTRFWREITLSAFFRQETACLKVTLHGTIRNTALQCWNNVVTIRNNVATMLQGCVALKIVVSNHLV